MTYQGAAFAAGARALFVALIVLSGGAAAVPAEATDGSASFILPDPESEVYYHFTFVAGDRIEIGKENQVTGNLHSNGDIDLKKDSVVTGDVSAVETIDNKGQIVGTATEGADPIDLPELLDADSLRALADRVFEGDTTLTDERIDDVVFVDGTVRVEGSFEGTGTLIATRDIRLGAHSGPADPNTRLSLIALDDIRLDARALSGVLRAGRDIDIEGDVVLGGVAIADRRVSVKDGVTTIFVDPDQTAPVIVLISPPDASLVATAMPEIAVATSDELSGIDVETLVFLLDGVDRTGEVTADETGFTFTPGGPLAEGPHEIEVAISDRSENEGREIFHFTVDTLGPTIEITAPVGPFLSDAEPAIVVTYGDETSGVDLATLAVSVDGIDVTASCTVEAASATCASPPLAEGEHLFAASIADQTGNGSATETTVTVDLTPPLITATATPPANDAGWNSTAVTVSFDCQDALSGVASCPDPVTLSTEGEGQVVSGTATDVAGNSATVEVTISIDFTPPTVTATAAPPANGAGWNNSPVTVSFDCQDALSGVAMCSPPVTLSAEGAGQVASGSGVDVAGNSATADATVSIDLTPPVFDPAELSPLPCPELTLELQPEVRACFADGLSGIAPGSVSLTVDGIDRTGESVLSGSCISWTPAADFEPGEHTAVIAAADVAGHPGSRSWCFEIASPVLAIAITSPPAGVVTDASTIAASGTVDPLAETVTVNGQPATVGGGVWSVTGIPLSEGKTMVTAVARNAAGGIGTATVSVVRDTAPPVIRIETPRAGAVLTSLQVDVGGLVNDIVTGTTINSDDCQVFVNGVEAEVANRSFLVTDLLLKRGLNTLVAEARDRVGNVSSHTIQVNVQDQAGQKIRLLAGNHQEGTIFEALAQPLIVVLENADGDPIPGRSVTFEVTRGDGAVAAFPEEGTTVTVVSDDFGRASARFRLGSRSGAGNNRVLATAPGFVGEVEFCASAATKEAIRVTAVAGDRQTGVVERPLPLPLVVLATDDAGNPVAGADVTFQVIAGGGLLGVPGEAQVVLTTDLDGLVELGWTLGPEETINGQMVAATLASSPEPGATFTATSRRSGRESATRVSGVVLDNQDNPVPGVLLEIRGTPLATFTDDQGQFEIAGAPVGAIVLEIDGSTTSRPGHWAHLEFELTTVAGRDNTVGRPIYLLPLDPGVMAGGDADVTLSLANVPGSELTVFAHSVTCPDGSPTCEVSVTQVRGERVPMPPPLGSSFMLAWTIQPAGAHFNPPARLCIPNADMPPGAQVEMFSFDHDQGEFVAIGTATVEADGSRICSDPGFGVVKAGWHGCTPPPPPKDCVADCGPCKRCDRDSGMCVNLDNGTSCDDENDCTDPDMCMAGSCMGMPKDDGTECEDDGEACTFDLCMAGSCEHPTPGLEVMLDAPNGFNINDTPEMPEITAMAQLTGIDPDPTADAMFRWETMIEYNACPARGNRDINEELDPVETGPEYMPAFPNIRGGMLTIKATLLRDGEDCEMGEEMEMIRGENPAPATVDGSLGGAMQMRMACQESQKRQFANSPGEPLMNCEPDGRIGVGILQVTDPAASDEAFWNWQQNVSEGLAILGTKQNDALGYVQRTRNRLGDPTIPDFTQRQFDCEWIQRFNGGSYWRWDAASRQWVQRANTSGYVALVFRWSTTGACMVVPAAQRPTCQ